MESCHIKNNNILRNTSICAHIAVLYCKTKDRAPFERENNTSIENETLLRRNVITKNTKIHITNNNPANLWYRPNIKIYNGLNWDLQHGATTVTAYSARHCADIYQLKIYVRPILENRQTGRQKIYSDLYKTSSCFDTHIILCHITR